MVSIRELAAHLDDYVERAARGEVIVIADGDQPVVELAPHRPKGSSARLQELVHQGLVIPPEKPLELPERGAKMRPGYSLSDVVIEERRADRLLG